MIIIIYDERVGMTFLPLPLPLPCPLVKNIGDKMKPIQAIQEIEEHGRLNIVHVQSVFPQEDVIALKKKTRESSIKDAVSKAVYHYLKCQKTDEDNA